MTKPFDAADLDTWPTETVEPTMLDRFKALSVERMVEEEDSLDQLGRELRALRVQLDATRALVLRVSELEYQLSDRQSPYADILNDAHDVICPEHHVDQLDDWLTRVEADVTAERQALTAWQQQPDAAPW